MSNTSDFIIENSVLRKYVGPGGEVVIPEGITQIGDYAFCENSKISKIVLPEGLIKIGNNAFEKCSKLVQISLPNSLKEIGEYAFRLCKKLQRIEIPGQCESTGWFAFEKCAGLESLVIHEGVKTVGYYSFADCVKLSEIVFPKSLEKIDGGAFNKCQALTELKLPENIKILEPSAFGDCKAVGYVTLPKAIMDMIDAKWFRSRFNNVDLFFLWLDGKTNFDDRVDELCAKSIMRKKEEYASLLIRENAANAMSKFLTLLGKVSINVLERYMVESTEKESAEVTAVLLAYKEKIYTSEAVAHAVDERVEKELGMKDFTVADWRNLFKFSTSGGKVKISGYLGNDTAVTVPSKIGKNPVTSVSISNYQGRKVTNAEKCGKVTSVVIENGVETICNHAFMKCTALQSVSIPDSVTQIEDWAFWGCTALKELHIPGSVEEIGISVFGNCPILTIYAPTGSFAEAYAIINDIPFVAE